MSEEITPGPGRQTRGVISWPFVRSFGVASAYNWAIGKIGSENSQEIAVASSAAGLMIGGVLMAAVTWVGDKANKYLPPTAARAVVATTTGFLAVGGLVAFTIYEARTTPGLVTWDWPKIAFETVNAGVAAGLGASVGAAATVVEREVIAPPPAPSLQVVSEVTLVPEPLQGRTQPPYTR